jgi:integrase
MGDSDLAVPPPSAVQACAQSIGDTRRFYTTTDTIADLDALRQALGVSTLTLDGAFVAERELRHYYASLLIRHGESVKTVQRRLGHATAAETLDTYSHLWPDSDDRTRDAIDTVLGAGVPQVCPNEQPG